MQVRRDARVARGSFSGAARRVNEILLSGEARDPRGISGHVRVAEPSLALRCGPCDTSARRCGRKKRNASVCRHARLWASLVLEAGNRTLSATIDQTQKPRTR
jgi:hypothetical protein